MWEILKEGFIDLVRALFVRPEEARELPMNDEVVSPIAPQEPILPPRRTPAQELCDTATLWLGRDPTPEDKVPDEVACVSSLAKVTSGTSHALPLNLAYTPTLLMNLKVDKRFRATLTPLAGAIIVSPTVGTNRGHCGIFITDSRIANNNSANGKWEDSYSFQGWVNNFKKKKGLHIYLFEPI